MRRRHFLQLSSSFALGALTRRSVNAWSKSRIVIVGGGIVGASICYRLAKRGAQVTLLEKTRPAAGATGKSFAWINANFSKQPQHYHLLSRLGVHAWKSLHDEIGAELPVNWGGTVEWYINPERAEELRRMGQQQQEWGYPIRFIASTEFTRLEPRISVGQPKTIAFSELEGSVDAGVAAQVLLRRAQDAGAKVVYPCNVVSIESRAGQGMSLKTSQGNYEGDVVVLACGVNTPELAALTKVAPVPLVPSPGIVMRTRAQPRLISRVLVTEDSHFRQQADGRVVIGDDFGPPATEIHKVLATQPLDFPDPAIANLHGERLREQAARYLPQLAKAEIASVALCWRPLPKDGFPIVGFASSPGVGRHIYLAVMHSGVTLGPLIGELVAMELLDGVQVDLLAPYRPTRF